MTYKFATTNPEKFANALSLCQQAGLALEQVSIDIDEIQGEDSRKIAVDKARRAFEITKSPVIVSDDSWSFTALGGFPGPYMKSVASWFGSEDFIRLLDAYEDRSVTLHQYLVYIGGEQEIIFQSDIAGKILDQPRGESKNSWLKVVSMQHDENMSVAELYNKGIADSPERLSKYPDTWHELINWLKEHNF